MLRKHGYRRRGFSLVELLAVMVILAMLAGIAAAGVRGYMKAARRTVAKTEIGEIVKAIDSYYIETGRYPTNDEGLSALKQATENFPSGIMSKIKTDPWKRPYLYRTPGVKGGAYDVASLGSDGKEGGTGEAADLRSDVEG
jgi:general secretion pathway protein G